MREPISFLRLYVDPAWRRAAGEVYSDFLCPFWGVPEALGKTHPHVKELFEKFSFDTHYYGITDDITQADAVFPPYTQVWLMRFHPDLLKECIELAKKAGLPLFVDGRADGEPPFEAHEAYITRIGGYRFNTSEKGRIEIPVPADDLLLRCAGGEFKARPKYGAKPIIGFSGMVREPRKNPYRALRTFIKKTLVRIPLYLRGGHYPAMDEGVMWRRKAVKILQASALVECNFKTRDYFSGSSLSAPVPVNQLLKEMSDIILQSDYALDVRGYANASTRLYEILSLGRIPVILDTERILPFSEEVDWRQFSLIVDYRDIKKLPQIIADFHASLSAQEFEAMQLRAREAFVNYFRVDAQMPYIIKELNIKFSTTS
jgi:hypothetical protein